MMGGNGGTLSTTGIAPEVMMKIYHTARSGDWDEATRMQYRILDVFQAMIQMPNFPEGFRAGYEARGFTVGHARFPVSRSESDRQVALRREIACLLAEFGFPEAAAVCQRNAGPVSSQKQSPANADIQRIVREVMSRLK
jgi:dihydrodipicolinate synthase/N-acetylneuraminate lyase